MRVSVIYVYPMVQLARYYPLAERFAQTWKAHDPGYPCQLNVIGNGGEVPQLHRASFSGIPNCEFREYGNQGWDIGAYQWAAETIPCDLMVCLGAPVHFHKAGWLDRMVEAFATHGPGLFGIAAYQFPEIHIRTTAFWFSPELLQSYPMVVGSQRASRYAFEHGRDSFTKHVMKSGFPCKMVTWSGEYDVQNWTPSPFSPVINGPPGNREVIVYDQFIHQ